MGAPAIENLAAGINTTGTTTGRIESQDKATSNTPKGRKGFAAMDPETRRRVASKGGKAAHANGHAHTWNSEEASAASLKRHKKPAKDAI